MKTPTSIGSFLGLVGYYRIFIKEFSKIMGSLTVPAKKSESCVWTDKNEDIFHTFKKVLCEAHVLSLPKEYSGLSCVLMQWGKVIIYASR